MPDKQFLGVADVARILGVSKELARQWMVKGWVPTVSMGKQRRVPRIALERWLQQVAEDALRRVTVDSSGKEGDDDDAGL